MGKIYIYFFASELFFFKLHFRESSPRAASIRKPEKITEAAHRACFCSTCWDFSETIPKAEK